MDGSFSQDLVGSFSQIKLKVYEESTLLSEFTNFLQNYIELYSSYVTKIKNIVGPLRKIIDSRNSEDSTSIFMKNFIQSIDNIFEKSQEYITLSLNTTYKNFNDFTTTYQENFKNITQEIDKAFHNYNEFEGKVIYLKSQLDEFKLTMNDISTMQQSICSIQNFESYEANEEKQKINKTTIKTKLKQYEYMNEVNSFNEFVNKTEKRFLELLNQIESNEKKRIVFIKDSMTNFLHSTLNFQNLLINHIIVF